MSSLIEEGRQVIIRKEKNMKIVQVRKNRKLWMDRAKFTLDAAIGLPYGTQFDVGSNGELVQCQAPSTETGDDDEKDDEAADAGKDNRNLLDDSDNQKLSKEDINKMRKKGAKGEEIIEQLVEHSATFKGKTEFAQAKYIKKKKKKYMNRITIFKPTTRLIAEMYYNRGPTKICNLRIDALAQILTQGNVRAGSKLMVVESCVGLLVGAVMERMAGMGSLIQLFGGSAPVRVALEGFNFPKEYMETLYGYPLDRVNSLRKGGVSSTKAQDEPPTETSEDHCMKPDPVSACLEDAVMDGSSKSVAPEVSCDTLDNVAADPQAVRADDTVVESSETKARDDSPQTESRKEKRKHVDDEERCRRRQWKYEHWTTTQRLIEEGNLDGLIVATKFHPTPVVMSLIDFVAPSRPIVVFCQYKEPLLDCYIKLRDRGDVILLKLSETWLRNYQVLPNRTHPVVNMSGSGGYLLTGTVVGTK